MDRERFGTTTRRLPAEVGRGPIPRAQTDALPEATRRVTRSPRLHRGGCKKDTDVGLALGLAGPLMAGL